MLMAEQQMANDRNFRWWVSGQLMTLTYKITGLRLAIVYGYCAVHLNC